MNCPNCNEDLKKHGISIEAVNHYSYHDDQDKFILEDVSLLPNDDSKIICNCCYNEIDIQLADLDTDIVI